MAKPPPKRPGGRLVDVLDAAEMHDGVLAYIDSLDDAGRRELLEIATAPQGKLPAAVRARAVYVLGALRWRPAFEPLRRLLSDESASVRLNAIHALGEVGGPHAVEPLLDLLDDPKRGVTEQAHSLASLSALGDEQTIERIERWVQKVKSVELKAVAKEVTKRIRLDLTRIG